MHNLLRFFILEFFECVTTVINYVLSLLALREKCPNTEFFLVRILRISPYSVRM